MLNNISEVTEHAKKTERLYTYRDGEILIKNTEDSQQDNTVSKSSNFKPSNKQISNKELAVPMSKDDQILIQERSVTHESSERKTKLVNKTHENVALKSESRLETDKSQLEEENLDDMAFENSKETPSDQKVITPSVKQSNEGEADKELKLHSFRNTFTKKGSKKMIEQVSADDSKQPQIDLNHSLISEIKENYSANGYSDDEKDTQNLILEQQQREQFDEFEKKSQDLLVAKLHERFKMYDEEVEEKIRKAQEVIRKEIKECQEYVNSLHNEIDHSNEKVKKEFIPITSDMNQLHSLLIQSNDNGRMLFANLKVVALFVMDLFEMIRLVTELIKQAEYNILYPNNRSSMFASPHHNSITIGDLNTSTHRPSIDPIDKTSLVYKKGMKLAKKSFDPHFETPVPLDKFKTENMNQIGNKMSIENKSDSKQKGNLADLIKSAYDNLQTFEIDFKGKTLTRVEAFETLENYLDKTGEKKNSLIFDYMYINTEGSKNTSKPKDMNNSKIMKSVTKLPAERQSITKVQKIKQIAGRATPSNANYKKRSLEDKMFNKKDFDKIITAVSSKEHNNSIFPQIKAMSPRNNS